MLQVIQKQSCYYNINYLEEIIPIPNDYVIRGISAFKPLILNIPMLDIKNSLLRIVKGMMMIL